jgi:hypothetical protein
MSTTSHLDQLHESRVAAEKTDRDSRLAAYEQYRLDGLSPTESARKAHLPLYMQRRPLKLIETGEMRARLQRAMLRAGATPRKLAETVVGALDATTFTKSGQEIPDHRARMLGGRLLKDILVPEDKGGGVQATQVVINLPSALAASYVQFAQTIPPSEPEKV